MAGAKPKGKGAERAEFRGIEELFIAYETTLLMHAHRLLQDREVAQDVVQEAFMKLHAQFDQIAQPKAWLFATVRNLALNHQRAQRKIVPVKAQIDEPSAMGSEPVDKEPLPDAQIELLEAIGQTQICLKALDSRSRELIRLRFEELLSYKEISARTGLSVGNVGYILHHTLKTLAADLEKSGIKL